jgi:signal transduction histidine kinase
MRHTVTRLVEEVRGTVSDLRTDQSVSLVDWAHSAATEAGADGPSIMIDIDERRPPRSAAALELGAMLTAALRHALEHSHARLVRVEGIVDRDRGSVRVSDDGDGFDVAESPQGHFGIIGMKERAAEIDATFDLSSMAGAGTVVTIEWGD